MAIASVRTLLALDRFAKWMNINPLHFNQVVVAESPAATCSMPLLQFSWQDSNRVGREEIAEAIAQAEDEIRQELGYSLLPEWHVEEDVRVHSGQYHNQSIDPSFGYVVSGGLQAKSPIELGGTISYSALYGQNYNGVATISVATSITDVNEISVYYPGKSGDNAYEVRPIEVSIANGVATITCARHQLVNLDLLESLETEGVDGLEDGNFLSTVDVYRKYNDPQTQIQLWRAEACCFDGTCESCLWETQYGCVKILDNRLGRMTYLPGTWNGTGFDPIYCHWHPDKLKLWYYAGWQNKSLSRPKVEMDPMWERVVTYLALARLDRPVCKCAGLDAFTSWWSMDLASNETTQAASSSTQLSRRVLDNPFGTTRAAVYAWRFVAKNRLGQGI